MRQCRPELAETQPVAQKTGVWRNTFTFHVSRFTPPRAEGAKVGGKMMRLILTYVGAATWVALLAGALIAQDVPRATVRGVVVSRETGQPIPNAMVSARGIAPACDLSLVEISAVSGKIQTVDVERQYDTQRYHLKGIGM